MGAGFTTNTIRHQCGTPLPDLRDTLTSRYKRTNLVYTRDVRTLAMQVPLNSDKDQTVPATRYAVGKYDNEISLRLKYQPASVNAGGWAGGGALGWGWGAGWGGVRCHASPWQSRVPTHFALPCPQF
jgi:hypothetical protein